MYIHNIKIEVDPVKCEACNTCTPLYIYERRMLCRRCIEKAVLSETEFETAAIGNQKLTDANLAIDGVSDAITYNHDVSIAAIASSD